jgi:nicotinamidase-related amidase
MTTAPYSGAEIVERSSRLANCFREKNAPVVYVRVDVANLLALPVDAAPRDPNTPPPPASFSELLPEAGFEEDDLVITKRHWGAFAGTELEQMLKERGIETVVITGIATNVGVESTVRQGTGLGFAFVVVEDACGARDAADHHYVFKTTFPRLARVRKTDEVITALG